MLRNGCRGTNSVAQGAALAREVAFNRLTFLRTHPAGVRLCRRFNGSYFYITADISFGAVAGIFFFAGGNKKQCNYRQAIFSHNSGLWADS